MMNSRSRATISKRWGVVAVVVALFVGFAGVAHADRKRVVVLDLEGPKAGRFHDELVRLLKKSQTVVTTDAWNGTAAQIGATTSSEHDLRKVAKQLRVDAIVLGVVERRRDQFILRLKLHDGKTGAQIGSGIHTQADGPRLDGQAERELRDELVDVIEGLPAGGAGADAAVADDESAKPARTAKQRRADAAAAKQAAKAKRSKKPADDDDDAEAASKPPKKAKPADDDDDQAFASAKLKADDDDATQQAFARRSDDERGGDRAGKPAARKADDDRPVADEPAAAPRKAAKQVAQREPERDAAPVEDRAPAPEPRAPANALSPGERALDVVAGVSVTQRDLNFTSRAGLATKPPGYSGSPVAGVLLDATLYPLAIGHHRTGILKDLGVTVLIDRVLKIDSKNAAGMVFPTTQFRYAAGVKYRHAFGASATAPVLVASLTYNYQGFEITNSAMANIPSIDYQSVEPAVGGRLPLTERWSLGLDLGVPLVTDTGEISQPTQYGTAKILGIEGVLAVDYLITRSLFARVAFRYETIVHTFDGNGTQTNAADGDATTVDVTSARDSYIGGFATVGALF